jgi:hypothetical protein
MERPAAADGSRFRAYCVRFVGLPAVPQDFLNSEPTAERFSYCPLLPTRKTGNSLSDRKKAGWVAAMTGLFLKPQGGPLVIAFLNGSAMGALPFKRGACLLASLTGVSASVDIERDFADRHPGLVPEARNELQKAPDIGEVCG